MSRDALVADAAVEVVRSVGEIGDGVKPVRVVRVLTVEGAESNVEPGLGVTQHFEDALRAGGSGESLGERLVAYPPFVGPKDAGHTIRNEQEGADWGPDLVRGTDKADALRGSERRFLFLASRDEAPDDPAHHGGRASCR